MDKIVYLLISNGGGVDGRDPFDKGGQILAASYTKGVVDKAPNHARGKVEARVIDEDRVHRQALRKLDPLDRLVLNLEKQPC